MEAIQCTHEVIIMLFFLNFKGCQLVIANRLDIATLTRNNFEWGYGEGMFRGSSIYWSWWEDVARATEGIASI